MCLLHARAVYGSVVVFHGIGQTQLLQVIEYIYIYIVYTSGSQIPTKYLLLCYLDPLSKKSSIVFRLIVPVLEPQ